MSFFYIFIRNHLNKFDSFVQSDLCDYKQLVYHDWSIPNYLRSTNATTVASRTSISFTENPKPWNSSSSVLS